MFWTKIALSGLITKPLFIFEGNRNFLYPDFWFFNLFNMICVFVFYRFALFSWCLFT